MAGGKRFRLRRIPTVMTSCLHDEIVGKGPILERLGQISECGLKWKVFYDEIVLVFCQRGVGIMHHSSLDNSVEILNGDS